MKSFIKNSTQRFITATILATLFWIVFFYFPIRAFSLLLGIILGFILLFEWNQIFKRTDAYHWLILPLYPVLPFILLIWMNEHAAYHILVYLLFITVFTFDSGAYFFGSLLGRYKLWPRISPGKTLEGAIGGYASALIMILFTLYQEHLLQNVSLLPIACGTAIICAIALFGDFFESLLKRQAGLKDTGSILPGHGGFLDRFDAVMMVSYFVFITKSYIAAYLTGL
jgi:phosphatidate cytidylyltransferase